MDTMDKTGKIQNSDAPQPPFANLAEGETGEPLPQVNFILIAQPRSGSSMLAHTLRQHPNIRMYGELFQDEWEARSEGSGTPGELYRDGENAETFLRKAIFRKRYWRQLFSVGFKLLYQQARQDAPAREVWNYVLKEPSLRIIHLKRSNKFESYVSFREAEMSDIWIQPVAAENAFVQSKKRNDEDTSSSTVTHLTEITPITIDGAKCEVYLNHITAIENWMSKQLASERVLELNYDQDICQDFAHTLKRILSFLDTPQMEIQPQLKKLTTVPVNLRVQNYQELKRYFALTIHKDFFTL